MKYVSRAGDKLEHALFISKIILKDLICADFGSNVGGFVDCVLENGANKVYAVETGYGILDWKLRTDSRVVVMERTNAMHIILPEKVDFISIDTSWTKLEKIVPNALLNLKKGGKLIALVKPHYEAKKRMLSKGKLKDDFIEVIIKNVEEKLKNLSVKLLLTIESPILGEKAKNREFLIVMEKIS